MQHMESELISFLSPNSIRTRVRDKQLVVLEKFLNSQENVKLPFLPFVVEMLVLGSIPLSV